MSGAPLLEAIGIHKSFGPVVALDDVTFAVGPGAVACLLGDNGAGKSTLIKILSGVLQPDGGAIHIDGRETRLSSPGDALDRGIATVYQDLAAVPVMPVYRNFFLGREPVRGWGILRRFDKRAARKITHEQLLRIGIDLEDNSRAIATLSGGQRQCVAIARAVHFGAKVLILDEPTSALGVKEAEIVLRYVVQARHHGIGVVFITHNVHHAYAVGDTFTILNRGRLAESVSKSDVTVDELVLHMAGGEEFERLADLLNEQGELGADSNPRVQANSR